MKNVFKFIICFFVLFLIVFYILNKNTRNEIKLSGVTVIPKVDFENIEVFIRFTKNGKENIVIYRNEIDFDYKNNISDIPNLSDDEINNIKAYKALIQEESEK